MPMAAHASEQSDEARLMALSDRIVLRPTEALTAPQQTFKIVWELEAEVNNGGFDQYFSNTSGRDAPRAAAALRAIGAFKCAQIVEAAVGRIDERGLDWPNDARRRQALTKFDADRFSDLDERFFAYPDPLSALLYRFVVAHPADF